MQLSVSSPTVSVTELPVDGSVPKVRVLVRAKSTVPNRDGKVLFVGTGDRTDIRSPELTLNAQEFGMPRNVVLADLDATNGMDLVFQAIGMDDAGKDVTGQVSSNVEARLEAVDIKAIINANPEHFKKTEQKKNPKDGKNNSPQGGGSSDEDRKTIARLKEQMAENERALKEARAARKNNPDGGNGGNSGGGGFVYPPIVVSNPPPANQPEDNGKFYIAVVIAVVAGIGLVVLGAIYGWMVYKTPAVTKTTVDVNVHGDANIGSLRRGLAVQQLKNIRTDDQPAAAAVVTNTRNVSHEIDLTGGEIRPAKVDTVVRDSTPVVARREVVVQAAYPVSSYPVASIGVSYHAGSYNQTYSAPAAPYCPPAPVEVTRVVSRSQGVNHVLTSSPAFQVSNDLVNNGNGFYVGRTVVASNNNGSHRSGRR